MNRLLKLSEVMMMTGFSRYQVDRASRAGLFPKPAAVPMTRGLFYSAEAVEFCISLYECRAQEDAIIEALALFEKQQAAKSSGSL